MPRCLATAISIACLLFSTAGLAADKNANIEKMLNQYRIEAKQKGWTFDVGYSPILEFSIRDTTGLIVPKGWQDDADFIDIEPARHLPTHFDWQQVGGGLTRVKSQGSCGSCWAFATTASFESTLHLRGFPGINLSEQHLVSCNRSGWSCSGGWWAHKYQRAPGVVLEDVFPYTASNARCPNNLEYGEAINRWAFVQDDKLGIPPVENIKNAVYKYGVLTVGVTVTSRFRSYSNGVFNACYNNGSINHAVNIVGWDDEGEYWIMRNSWGSDWGEDGYMRIKWDCNRIGYGASFVDYESSCQPEPVADAGDDQAIAAGDSAIIGTPARENTTYEWFPASGLDDPKAAMPVASPGIDTVYTLAARTECGLTVDNVLIEVTSGP